MADRTVRAIFEARVTQAKRDITSFGTDVDKTGKKVEGLDKNLTALDKKKVKPQIDLDIAKAEKEVAALKAEIERLDALEATPEVLLDFSRAQAQLGAVESELKALNGRKAEIEVTADTSKVDDALDGLGDAGKNAGDDAGEGVVSGILDALRSIPIAGAVIGVGVAIGAGLFEGIKDGLSVEAGRDFFSAQTGLDEATSARFGRAAGEAYANAWGDSVAANLDTARRALQAGIIDQNATDAEIENVIAKLSGIADLFQYDIAESVRAVGNLMRTGLVKDANQAFDLIVAASQKVSSDDLIDTITEYSNQFVLLGLTAEEAFGLITQGAEAGARDTDNIADTLKEMGLRISEGTDPAVKALQNLGLNAGDIIKAFQEGGPKATAAMDKVFDALRELEEKGGNTQAVIAALFGGAGEDLGAALFALDLDTVAESLGGVEGAAGAADRALATMSDNTATKVEQAKRNIELAVQGIQGALAETFGDDIGNAADWVAANRAPLMQFFLDVITGTIEMGKSFLTFSADAQDAIADVIVAIAEMIDALPGDQSDLKTSMLKVADGLRSGAEAIRDDVIPALDEAEDRARTWAAPEILKARIHDATFVMTQDLKGFIEQVGKDDLSITINGDTVSAEEALATLVDNINAEDGTVLINGDSVPAEDALDTLLELIRSGEEDVSVGADTDPARSEVRTFQGIVSRAEATMSVDADTAAAKKALAAITGKDYYATVRVNVVSNRVSQGLGGQHDGGYITTPGLYSGGRVPGRDPGYDNVLWPLNAGGRTLMQPLAGGEYVVNSKDAAFWGPVLEWMNGGGRPVQTFNETSNAPVYIDKVVGLTISEVEREAAARRRRAALDPARQASR